MFQWCVGAAGPYARALLGSTICCVRLLHVGSWSLQYLQLLCAFADRKQFMCFTFCFFLPSGWRPLQLTTRRKSQPDQLNEKRTSQEEQQQTLMKQSATSSRALQISTSPCNSPPTKNHHRSGYQGPNDRQNHYAGQMTDQYAALSTDTSLR